MINRRARIILTLRAVAWLLFAVSIVGGLMAAWQSGNVPPAVSAVATAGNPTSQMA